MRLLLIGDGPEREDLVTLAQSEGISSSVHLLGLRKDIPQVLSAMNIFALASLSEGMPGVLIEAGLSGLPSVAYDVGGVTEVLNHDSTGLVVPSNEFGQFVDGLEELITRPEWRKQIGEQARSWCRARFDLSSVASQYEQLFNQLLSGEQLSELDSATVNADS